MPLSTASVGLKTEALTHHVDARWTMSYAAGLGDTDPVYLDTANPGGVVAHPLFAICPEWPVALASRDLLKTQGLTAAEFRRAVHASHDSHVYRLIEAGEDIVTESTVLKLEKRRPGTFVTTCFDNRTTTGELVCRTFHGMLFRGVELEVDDDRSDLDSAPAVSVPAPPPVIGVSDIDQQFELPVARNFAHVYTECARIFNPIHTDIAVAKSAGLPDFILHGSATLALAVSSLVNHYAGGDPACVSRITGEFRGMVLMPSVITLRTAEPRSADHETVIGFDVINSDGRPVIGKGAVTLRT
ncbi:MAG: MaoC/PaaZ C-terminal domain-containing protein [Gammaproteobacteria bacterium]